jgi:hypothetical protein
MLASSHLDARSIGEFGAGGKRRSHGPIAIRDSFGK